MSIEARQIQETLYSYAAILNFTPSPQGLRAKFSACSVQNTQLLMLIANAITLVSISYEYTTANHFNFLTRHWTDYVQLSYVIHRV